MLKKISKIGGTLALFLFGIYNTCFADLITPIDDAGDIYQSTQPIYQGPSPIAIVIITVLGVAIAACTLAIVISVLSTSKNKEVKVEKTENNEKEEE